MYPSWTGVPPYGKTISCKGWPGSPLEPGEGHLTDVRVCLHYWVVIWVAGYCNPPYIAQFFGYVMGSIHLTLRSYSVLDILLPPIIIIMQECSKALKTCKRLQGLSSGGVSNMLLLSITFVINIYGGVCVQLTHFISGDWNDIFIAHVIIIIKSEVSTFPIVVVFFRGRVSEMLVTSYFVTYCIFIPGKLGFCSHHYCAVYDQCK